MRHVVTTTFFAASLLGLAIAGHPPAAYAAVQDGNWSVLIITETGPCDRGYRYDVNVANGQVNYTGAAAVNLSGTVEANGAVKVRIRVGDKGANGTGHLTADSGTGTWRGAAANSGCAGRWEAEKR